VIGIERNGQDVLGEMSRGFEEGSLVYYSLNAG